MKLKTKPLTQALSERYGGKWKHRGFAGTWECDDGVRYVCGVLTERDFDGEYTGGSSLCLYYRDGSKSPEWVYL